MDPLAQEGIQIVHQSQSKDQETGDKAQIHGPETEILQTKPRNICKQIQALILQSQKDNIQSLLLRIPKLGQRELVDVQSTYEDAS